MVNSWPGTAKDLWGPRAQAKESERTPVRAQPQAFKSAVEAILFEVRGLYQLVRLSRRTLAYNGKLARGDMVILEPVAPLILLKLNVNVLCIPGLFPKEFIFFSFLE